MQSSRGATLPGKAPKGQHAGLGFLHHPVRHSFGLASGHFDAGSLLYEQTRSLARATIVLPGKGKVWIKKSAIVKALGPLRHFFRYRGICILAISHDMLDMYKMQKLSRHAARRRATGGPPLAVGIGASLAVVSSQLQLSQDGPECPRQGVHSLRNRAQA